MELHAFFTSFRAFTSPLYTLTTKNPKTTTIASMISKVTFAPPVKGLGRPYIFLGRWEYKRYVITLSSIPSSSYPLLLIAMAVLDRAISISRRGDHALQAKDLTPF
jgi:hypothetical protein